MCCSCSKENPNKTIKIINQKFLNQIEGSLNNMNADENDDYVVNDDDDDDDDDIK